MEVREFETNVIEVIKRTSDAKSFRFAVPDDIEFKQGQFFFVTIRINSREVTKHFSFSNSPTEKGYIEFTKRLTESEFSKALDRLKLGDWARIRMPYGIFTFEGEYEKIAFLAGGIGITPVRSICKCACDKKFPTDIVLIYGNKTEGDIVFREDFLAMEAENKNMRVVYTVDNALDKNKWNGKVGFITAEMIREEMPDYDERVFYVCGPPKMVDYLKILLGDDLKINDERMKIERFSGYQ
jgi:ferredoxin-NADP reductase